MAMLFDLDTERDNRAVGGMDCGMGSDSDPVDSAFALITDHIGGLDPRSAVRRIRRYKQQLAAMENHAIAKLTRDTGSDKAAKRLLNDGKTSRGSIAKAARRGQAASKNADLIDKMAAGDLSEEQLDVIAETSDKTDGAAALDADFIAEVAGVDPDQAKGVADKFIADHADPDGVASEHDRQRKLRRASKYHSKKKSLDVIGIEGDGVAIKNMFDAITARADELYQADGGRDVNNGHHPRTRDQRRFDAAYELICGVTTTPFGTKPEPRPGKQGENQSAAKPQIFVGVTLEQYLGLDPQAMAEQIGLGLIPDSVLADYLEHADILGVLYDKHGSPLWIGRARRHATLMQRYALIARDKACVKCRAPHQECEVHHLTPWSSPAKGETNLDELALLCGPCHRELHANNHTLYQDANRTWRTRPATPDETPPKPINYPQRE